MKKRKQNTWKYWFLRNNGIQVLFSGLIIIILCVATSFKSWGVIFDWSVFFAVVATWLLTLVSGMVSDRLLNRFEDDAKLESNPEVLREHYKGSLNCSDKDHCLLEESTPEKVIPVYVEKKDISIPLTPSSNNKNLVIEDKSILAYQLPDFIKEHYEEIFSAHNTSNTYNSLNIRLDHWDYKDNVLTLCTSRTTYYNSLVTNRALDYKWKNGEGLTVRDLYSYGPFLESLDQSRLSNHLGFNAFVITSDHYIPQIKRNGYVSIAKNTYACSIGASLKTLYALNKDGKFTVEGLYNGIVEEAKDELFIEQETIQSVNIIAAYRDIVEGGKPQLLVVIQVSKNKEDFNTDFYNAIQGNKSVKPEDLTVEQREQQDGEELVWFTAEDIHERSIINSTQITIKGQSYATVPSTSASFMLFKTYLSTYSNNK